MIVEETTTMLIDQRKGGSLPKMWGKTKEYGVLIATSHATLEINVGGCMENPKPKIGEQRKSKTQKQIPWWSPRNLEE